MPPARRNPPPNWLTPGPKPTVAHTSPAMRSLTMSAVYRGCRKAGSCGKRPTASSTWSKRVKVVLTEAPPGKMLAPFELKLRRRRTLVLDVRRMFITTSPHVGAPREQRQQRQPEPSPLSLHYRAAIDRDLCRETRRAQVDRRQRVRNKRRPGRDTRR
jgi:hypothetical protein